MAVANGGNEDLILGVASILQQASNALAQLGVASQQGPGGPRSGARDSINDVPQLASAVSALSQLASQFGSPSASSPQGAQQAAANQSSTVYNGEQYAEVLHDEEEPSISVADFVQAHQLESWVGEALDLLTPGQRASVMNPQMNLGNARNLNGIVISRIKQVVPLEQRLGLFVQINGLAEGVVDRIRTLTPEQAESLMESGMKIQKASNPSGVAMRRITDVLRQNRQSPSHSHAPSKQYSGSQAQSWRSSAPQNGGGYGSRDRSRTPTTHMHSSQSPGDMPTDVQRFMDSMGLDWWVGEVLKRLSMWQRQEIMKEFQNTPGIRNPSGVVMSRVRQFVEIGELVTIFIDLNQLDHSAQEQLLALNSEQQAAVITPGIYLQNMRNPSTGVRSRIMNVLAGNDAFGKPLGSSR